MLLDVASNMQTLGIMSDSTHFVSATGGDLEDKLALRVPGTFLSQDIDVQSCRDHMERGLSWPCRASTLKILRLGITGRVGCFAGIDLVDANIECLEVLTLTLGIFIHFVMASGSKLTDSLYFRTSAGVVGHVLRYVWIQSAERADIVSDECIH